MTSHHYYQLSSSISIGSTSGDLEVEVEEKVEGVTIEGNKYASSLMKTPSLTATAGAAAEEALFSVDTIAEDNGVLFPPPNNNTSSPITVVTHISGLFGFDVKVSASPMLHGGLLGK